MAEPLYELWDQEELVQEALFGEDEERREGAERHLDERAEHTLKAFMWVTVITPIMAQLGSILAHIEEEQATWGPCGPLDRTKKEIEDFYESLYDMDPVR